MKQEPIAKYRCLKCDREHERRLPQTVQDRTGSECPFCGHLYVKWTNYSPG